MTHLVPGFTWHPIDVGNRAARRKGRGLIGHVAVSASKCLVPSGTPATRGADWHFYLPKSGPGFQFIDLDLQSWSSGGANADTVSFESEGGLGNSAQVNAEPWTEDQINNAAAILRHLHDTEGVPLQVMPNSLPGSRGFGFHRLGIDPWRVSGGQVWSSSRGKLCPGDAKIAQAAEIVRRAGGNVPTPSPAPTPDPAPVPGCPGLPAWSLPRGHYYGLITGPAQSHGGYYPAERAAVQAIQRRLIAKGYVPGVGDWRSGWADGKFEQPTADAVTRFQRAEMPGTQFYGQVWSDDYARLAR